MKRITSVKKSNNSKKSQAQSSQFIAAPAAMGRQSRASGNSPSLSMSQIGDGRIRVRHREFLADLAGSVAFATTLIPLNPGLSSTYPWLANIAQNYESYLQNGLSVEFQTSKPTSAAGSVALAIDFDANDSAPLSKQQLMTYHGAVRTPVWSECTLRADPVDLKKFGQQRFVRSGTVVGDIKTYDIGNLIVATVGMADNSVVGELYLCYDVELDTPQSEPSGGVSCKLTATGSIALANPFGSTAPTLVGDNIATMSGNDISFLSKNSVLVNIYLTGTGFDNSKAVLTTGSVGTFSMLPGGGIQTVYVDSATTHCYALFRFDATLGDKLSLDFVTNAVATTITGAIVRVSRYTYSNHETGITILLCVTISSRPMVLEKRHDRSR